MEALRIKRRQCKAAVTRQENTLNKLIVEEDTVGVEDRLKTLKDTFLSFEDAHYAYHDKLDEDSDIDKSEKWFNEVYDQYIDTVKAARAWLYVETDIRPASIPPGPEMAPSGDAGESDMLLSGIATMLCLPKLEIPKFNGIAKEYQTFIAIFDECIGNKISINDQTKLIHLIHYTEGLARAAVRDCTLVGGALGYKQAREILKDRFGNVHLVTQRIISDLRNGKSAIRPNDLQQLADDLSMAQSALSQMGTEGEVNTQQFMIDVLQRCHSQVRSRWRKFALEFKVQKDTYPDFGQFVKFISKVAREACDPIYGLDCVKSTKSASCNLVTNPGVSQPKSNVQDDVCCICNGNHSLFGCDQFKAMRPKERLQTVILNKLCFNCLSRKHFSRECPRSATCSVPGCSRKHTKFIHVDEKRPASESNSSQGHTDSSGSNSQSINVHSNAVNTTQSCVYLPIVPVKVDNQCVVYALLDSGSTNTLVSKRLAKTLNLKGDSVTCQMSTVSSCSTLTSQLVSFNVTPMSGNHVYKIRNAFIVSDIPANRPASDINLSEFSHLSDLPLGDVKKSVHVDILIGMDNSDLLIPLEVRVDTSKRGQPYATRTVLGWTLQGPSGDRVIRNVQTHHVQLDQIEQQIQNMWNIEREDECVRSWSVEDQKVYDLWQREIIHENGHYTLPIPWKSELPCLPNNKFMAERRLASTVKRLHKTCNITLYDENIQKMLNSGYAERVPEDDLLRNDGKVWYLPHHAVTSESKPGKVRIVFDCAATCSSVSLNNQCLQGPDLNNKLLHVLLRFRQFQYGAMGDIEAMYHQVRIPVKDRDCLRFLWLQDDEIVELRMTSHLFGGVWCAGSSTFALRQTIQDFSASELVSDTVSKDFYVDDMLKSVDSRVEVREVVSGTKEVLQQGGFNLVKFVVNDESMLREIPEGDRAQEVKDIVPDRYCKALGIRWDVRRDMFLYAYMHSQVEEQVTKRIMLSRVSSMYDPLGLISPIVVYGRMLFQEAVRLGLSWDERVSTDLESEWRAWVSALDGLSSVVFPRNVIPHEFLDTALELHHFCDSSSVAYGACSYVRGVNKVGQVHVGLLYGKARLAPLKSVTIPRLELCAAVTAVKVDSVIRRVLQVPVTTSTFWSDSQIVLSYIRSESHRLKVFVANRVSYIQDNSSSSQWKYIPSKMNPADILSRGCLPKDLPMSWGSGPQFLSEYKSTWPVYETGLSALPEDDPELKLASTRSTKCHLFVQGASVKESHPLDCLIKHYSSFYKLKKALSWLIRVVRCLMHKGVPVGVVSVKEMKHAELLLLQHVQRQEYHEEISDIQSGRTLRKSSSIYQFSPLMSNGLLVVGGRLKHASTSTLAKFPVILPVGHPLSSRILEEFHGVAHLGTEWVLSIVRSRFWIPRARSKLKQIKRQCLVCRKLYGSPMSQRMADLPLERCNASSSAFQVIGVDLFGPFYVKLGRAEVKRYGCVYTCFSSRAIHLEVLNSLETESFINGFIRFCARRGYPRSVQSDNGTNMVGAQAELSRALRHLNRSEVIQTVRRKEVEWVFNPPLASHHGGIWERMIRTVRRVLLGVLNTNVALTDEVLCTVFCEVECLINSRPITKCSDDVNDDAPLTPNHILLLKGNYSLSWGKFGSGDIYRKRWRHVQSIVTQFWRRWLKEYLPELQKRHKWVDVQRNLKVGDLVMLVDENASRGVWPLGLVKGVNVGRDGLVRSARIKTRSSEFVRPITKVVLLEACD